MSTPPTDKPVIITEKTMLIALAPPDSACTAELRTYQTFFRKSWSRTSLRELRILGDAQGMQYLYVRIFTEYVCSRVW